MKLTIKDTRERLKKRAQEDDRLYERYGKSLEAQHKGEFVAIGHDGQVIVSKDDIAVIEAALKRFGSGNFAFRRVGFRTLGKWRQSG